jgi:glycosyltransferase involved in cell wall biosynthesis
VSDLAAGACEISLVIPAFNEAESLPELVEIISNVMKDMAYRYEVWIIDDGSSDGTFDVVRTLAAAHPAVHGVSFSRNYGKAAALSAGFAAAAGEIIVTLDADLQDDPAEIPRLLAKIREDGCDLVSGWKQDRQDSFIKNHSSKLFNAVTSWTSGLRLHDFNCGLKAYRGELARSLRIYGELHRYIPALAHLDGYKVAEIPVRHHARRYGRTKYGPARFLNGFLDLLTVKFLSSRATSPLHFFGRVGLVTFLLGAVINGYFLWQWLTGHGLHIRPLLLLGVALILLAVQFVSLGLVAELIAAGQHPEADYRVRDRV